MTKTQLIKPAQELQARLRKRSAFPIKSRGPITALDWDGPVLRAVQSVPRGGKSEISFFAAGQIEGALNPAARPDYEPKASGAALAQALHSLRLKPSAVVMGIPRGLVFLRTLSLPKPGTPDELAAMVHFQISKDLPFRLDEAVVDYQVSEAVSATPPPAPAGNGSEAAPAENTPATEKLDVLVAVVRKEVVQRYHDTAEAAGFTLAALGLGSYANMRGLQACGLAKGPGAVALVSLRHDEVTIDIIAGNSLAFSRTAPLTRPEPAETAAEPPTKEAKEPEADILETIGIEVVRSLHNYGGLERQEPVSEILVVGDGGREGDVAEALAQRCGLPCRQLNPAGELGLKRRDGAQDTGGLTALGLALSAQDQTPWPFDFLHPKRPPVPRNRRRVMLIKAAVAGALVLCVAWGVRAHLIHKRLKAKDEVEALIAKEAKNRALYRDMRLKAKITQDWMHDKREWLDHYAYLSALLPSCTEVYVTSISAGTRGVLHVSIQARSGEILARLDKQLRQAGYDLKPLAVTPCSDKNGYNFQSSLELTLPTKMKAELAALKAPDRPADDGSLDGPRPRAGAPGADGSANAARRRNRP